MPNYPGPCVCAQLAPHTFCQHSGCAADVFVDTDFRGGDLDIASNGAVTGSLQECCSNCTAQPGCIYFTWDAASTKSCWLKGQDVVTVSSTGAIGGSIRGLQPHDGGCSLLSAAVCDTASGTTFQNECIAKAAGVAMPTRGCCTANIGESLGRP